MEKPINTKKSDNTYKDTSLISASCHFSELFTTLTYVHLFKEIWH